MREGWDSVSILLLIAASCLCTPCKSAVVGSSAHILVTHVEGLAGALCCRLLCSPALVAFGYLGTEKGEGRLLCLYVFHNLCGDSMM